MKCDMTYNMKYDMKYDMLCDLRYEEDMLKACIDKS